jgi:hypothetical protein
MSVDAGSEPINRHQLIRMKCRRNCVACQGLRHWDRPQKRRALSEIAGNTGRKSDKKMTSFGCKQCDVWLCKTRACFDLFHNNS